MRLLAPFALAAPATALAAEAPAAAAPVSATPMLGALVAVVAAIFALAWILKRAGLKGTPGGAALLKPVATLPLGTRERLVVVQVADRWLVLGVTAQSIQPLADLEAKPLPEAPAAAAGFRDALAKALKRDA